MLIYSPRQAVLVTCQGSHEVMGVQKEIHDVVPLTWHSPSSSHPPLYSIFVQKDLAAASLIRKSGGFVVNFVSWDMIDIVKKAQSISGEFTDKAKDLGLAKVPTEKIVDCFKIKNAVGWLECEVMKEIEVGDNILFVGKVVLSEMKQDSKRPFHIEKDNFTTTN